jgi:dolichol kinase
MIDKTMINTLSATVLLPNIDCCSPTFRFLLLVSILIIISILIIVMDVSRSLWLCVIHEMSKFSRSFVLIIERLLKNCVSPSFF